MLFEGLEPSDCLLDERVQFLDDRGILSGLERVRENIMGGGAHLRPQPAPEEHAISHARNAHVINCVREIEVWVNRVGGRRGLV